MAGRTDGESLVEDVASAQTDRESAGLAATSASANVLRWEADATATEPCGPGMPAFLAEAASTDLVLRMDESVVGCEGASLALRALGGALAMLRARAAPAVPSAAPTEHGHLHTPRAHTLYRTFYNVVFTRNAHVIVNT